MASGKRKVDVLERRELYEGSHQFKDVGDKSYVAFYVETDTLQSHRPLVSTASKFM